MRHASNFESLKEYYEGSIVRDYDRKRKRQAGWQAEQDALTRFLRKASLRTGSLVLDIPVGTGRFLDTYARLGYRVLGIDISADMLDAARHRSRAAGLQDAVFEFGDATQLRLGDKSVDLAVSVRFLNHMELETVRSVIAELARVAKRFLILHIRIARPVARGLRLAAATGALRRGWEHLEERAAQVFKRKKVVDTAATIHPETAIHEIFAGQGLTVLDEIVVHRRVHRSFEARMYLLAFERARRP